MAIETGMTLPNKEVLRKTGDGIEAHALSDLLAGKRAVLFGVPGAFTPTCSAAHLPSFIRTADDFREKGIDAIYCLTVNDPHVAKAWADSAGAEEAGIIMLADPEAAFGKALDITFSAPPVGLIDRLQRFALIANDGVVEVVHFEEERGICDMTAGETLLDSL